MKFKRLLALLLIAVLAFSLAACGGDNNDNSDSGSKKEESKTVDGKYWLYSMAAEGETVGYETIKLIGMDSSYLEIKGDKFVLALTGEEAGEGTHDAKKKQLISPDGEAITYTVDGEKVSFTIEGSKLEFVKDGSSLLTPSDASKDGASVDGAVCGNYVLVGEGYSEGNY